MVLNNILLKNQIPWPSSTGRIEVTIVPADSIPGLSSSSPGVWSARSTEDVEEPGGLARVVQVDCPHSLPLTPGLGP